MRTQKCWARSVTLLSLVTLAGVLFAGFAAPTPAQAAQAAQAAQKDAVAGTEVVRGDTVPTVAHLGPHSFTAPGPLGVGETTLTLPTDGAPVEVWYPATKQSVAGNPEAPTTSRTGCRQR